MKSVFPTATIAIACFALTLTPASFTYSEEFKKPLVYVPVLPYEYLFERIGGDWIEVHAIVQEGGDCHEYSPSPRQLTSISKSNLLFTGDLGFEANFFVAVGDGINSPKSIDLLEGLELIEGSCHICDSHQAHGESEKGEEHKDHHHDHDELMDSHVWLSPKMLIQVGERVAGILKDHTPAKASAEIDDNLAQLREELTELDAELREALEPMKGQAFYVYHAAFAYFALDYGLEQKAIEIAGRRPTPKQVAEIAKQAKEEGVRVVFVQPQFDQSSAVSLADTIGGKVQTLDPLEKDVIANLRTIAETIRLAN